MSVQDNTQTDDNDMLSDILNKRPTFNPVHCDFVSPKRSLNSLKVEQDITLTIDYLSRGIEGFHLLPTHLQTDILAKSLEFQSILHKAYVSCIKLYHLQYTGKLAWDPKLYNLEIPDITQYLQGSYYTTESDDQTAKLKHRTNDLINNFVMNMYSLHEKNHNDQASIDFEFMMSTFFTLQEMVMNAAYCDLHELTNYADKVKVLTAQQKALNFVCTFAFPSACKTCSKLLDHILRQQQFEPGEDHQALILLPKFEEEILFKRLCPLPVEPAANPQGTAAKPTGASTRTLETAPKTPKSTSQTPKVR